MHIGVPRETKPDEYRVALTPAWANVLSAAGHQVTVETGAGLGSGFDDRDYEAAGAMIAPDAATAWATGFTLKVKEPQPAEYALLLPGGTLACYLHLAADVPLASALRQRNVTAIAFETVQRTDGSLPLLAPMSEIAGRMATQVAARYLERTFGGKGKLLGGVAGVLPARVLILGGGTVGANAADVALGMGAAVTVVDRDLDRLTLLRDQFGSRLQTLASNAPNIAAALASADVVIGAVLIPGGRAPRLVTRAMLAGMAPGSVAIDVAVDQGGCIETSRPTTHGDPVYLVDGILHYGVANMPGAVPHTATIALANAVMPYMAALADLGLDGAVARFPELAPGLNTHAGEIVHPVVAAAVAAASEAGAPA